MIENRVLLILGMHRSGTSLSANWLGKCGLDLGQQLIGATPSNILGHFEDVDIVEFHESLLRYNHTNLYQGVGKKLEYTAYHEAKARSLIFLRDQFSSEWGWKQPRALLFSDLWRKVLPSAHYFFIYRPYNQVVSSLYRREFQKLRQKNSFVVGLIKQARFWLHKQQILRMYLSMWIRHNQEVIDLIKTVSPQQTLLVSVESLTKYDKQLFEKLTRDWGFHLHYVPVHSIYKEKLLSAPEKALPSGDPLVKEAEKITETLIQLETHCLQSFS